MLSGLISCKYDKTPEGNNYSDKKENAKKEFSKQDNQTPLKIFSDELIDLDNQATLLTYRGDKESYYDALELLNKAIQLDSTFFYAYETKAYIYTKLGKYDEAIEIYEQIAKEVKNYQIEVYSILGKLYDKFGEKTLAINNYEKTVEFYHEQYKRTGKVFYLVYMAHYTFIMDQEKGLEIIDSLIEAYPLDKDLPMYRQYKFIEYNHQKVLDNL